MLDRIGRVRLLYIVLGMLLVVGVLPLALAGWLLSDRSAVELGLVERRYQAQLVQDKARQIELYGQRYRDVVTGLAQAFELAGGVRALNEAGSDARLRKALTGDTNLSEYARNEADTKLRFMPGYVVGGKATPFSGRISGIVTTYEYTTAGKPMAGRVYYLQADGRTVYVLHFTGLRDKLQRIQNQTDAIARSFRLKQ